MDPKLKAAQERHATLLAEMKALAAKGEGATVEENERINAIDLELDGVDVEIKTLRSAHNAKSKIADREKFLNDPLFTVHTPDDNGGKKSFEIPANVKRSRVKAFKSDEYGTAHEKAYRFGTFCMGGVFGNEKAKQRCGELGIPLVKAHQENVNTTGGVLVPDEFENSLIDLKERYGLFRMWAKNTTMRRETKTVPRRTGGLTAYPVGEGKAITESEKGWDDIGLTARKWAVLAKFSSELDEDAVIDIGNDLAQEIAYSFAQKEDEAGFVGTGLGSYHGITGVCPKLKAVDATIANIAGLYVATGNLWSEFLLADFNNTVALLPEYADTDNCAWYCHKKFYHGVMERLMLAAGGVTAAEIAAGRREKTFMGYPVRITQKMPKTDANSQIACLFGDLALAALFGDRRETTIALSEHTDFANDLIAIRGTERYDINVHDVGDTTDAGPIVGLISAAS